mmetsp:Transcript_80388/g.206885  ORF Transcript_80388/g.206885 Transcript_80388/m.206885 type:complete len:467 (-) Transcript_80388:685-2085(-)
MASALAAAAALLLGAVLAGRGGRHARAPLHTVRDLLSGLREEVHQALRVAAVLCRREERDGLALVARAAGAADAVHVVLEVLREVEVDHRRQLWHVEAARRHVGGHEDEAGLRLEVPERLLACWLLLVAVDRSAEVAGLAQVVAQVLARALGAAENEDLCCTLLVQPVQRLHQHLKLLGQARGDDNRLRDIRVARELVGADLDVHNVLLEVTGEPLHSLRPGCRPEQRLPVRPDLPDDLAHVRLEAHVQHAVRLVHDQVGHTSQVCHTNVEKVNEPARRGDDDVRAALQRILLVALGGTAVAAHCPDLARHDLAELCLDLQPELARGRKHQHEWSVALLQRRLRHDVQQARDAERNGLARAGLCDAHHVSAGHGRTPTLGLDRCRRGEALPGEAVEHELREAGLLEREDGVRHVVSRDCDVVRSTPLRHLVQFPGIRRSQEFIGDLALLFQCLLRPVNVLEVRAQV